MDFMELKVLENAETVFHCERYALHHSPCHVGFSMRESQANEATSCFGIHMGSPFSGKVGKEH